MYRQNEAAKTITGGAAETIRWADNEIGDGALQELLIENTGAGNSIDAGVVSNLRVKCSGTPYIDCLGTQMRVMQEALWPSNTIPAAGRLLITIPLNLPGLDGSVGIPAGMKPSVEMVVTAAAAAGVSTIGWKQLPAGMTPKFIPRFISFAGNIATSGNNQRINLNLPNELIYGICVPAIGATGITRLKVTLNGQEIMELSRGKYLQSQLPTNPQSVITPFFVRMPILLPAPAGNSAIVVDSGAGTAATDEWAILTLQPV